ncbi:MAG TPA: portal protein [Dehalococcoidia bacterium]|nr:portal protein [Dehalococcoidia bacterium]HAS27875.1 portal protein [Dehalococcoidia bacterium]
MYIIIVGGGRLGYYLARTLLDEQHEVLIIEKDASTVQSIVNEMGSVCIKGDGCETAVLAEAGTNRADIFISVTGDDEDNLVACQVAKYKFNVPRTIARVRNPKHEMLFKKLGIDVTVSSTSIILEHIKHEVPTNPLMHLLSIKEKGLEIVEIKIQPDAKTVGKAIKDLTLPPESILALIIHRDTNPTAPSPATVLQAEDQIIAITRPDNEALLRSALTGN